MQGVKQYILGPWGRCLAVSRGVESVDQTEIVHMSARSGELASPANQAFSWNFFPLPSGRFCLSRTARLSAIFPDADPSHVVTHGLIVEAELLRSYANNAICLFQYLDRLGLWSAGLEVMRQILSKRPQPTVPPVLRTLTIDGGVEAVRLGEMCRVARRVGVRRFATILDHLLGNYTSIISGNTPPALLIGALLDALPVACRTEISFSTGLKFSMDRLVRIVSVGAGVGDQERTRRQFGVPVIASNSLSAMQDELLPSLKNRWSMFIATLLEQELGAWWGEIAILDDTATLSELSRLGRVYFRRVGLEDVYQKIREKRRESSWNHQMYAILQGRVENRHDALRLAGKFGALDELRDGQKTGGVEKAPNGVTPPLTAVINPGSMSSYLEAVADAVHGNPIAQFRLQELYQEITESVPESDREEVSDSLLKEGIRRWNQQRAETTNHSWRQVECMVDTLSTMLDMWSTSTGRHGA